MHRTTVTIGTRGSKLALRQTELVTGLLRDQDTQLDVRTVIIQTEADRFQERPIAAFGDKGVFVRAIERALLDCDIDIAIHSLKDLPADSETPGLVLAAFSAREDPRDCVISRSGGGFRDLAPRSLIGTSSLRRKFQLRMLRDDLHYVDIRGNVDTRLRKLDAGEFDAIVLAAAGLKRLGLEHRISQYLTMDECVPDAGQGIMAIQTRESSSLSEIVARIDEHNSRMCGLAERAAVRALGADCRSPVGLHATVEGETMHLLGVAAAVSGTALHRATISGPVADANALGDELGRRLLSILEDD